jgi:hypothetical protein
MEFTSQVGQDKWVCETLRYKRKGYFLEIGAYDGIHFSNTYYLEKELGWDGVCVEAGRSAFCKLIKNRSCLVLNRAIGRINDKGFFVEEGEIGRLVYGSVGAQQIEVISMEHLLSMISAPTYIDYISLDIEGDEYNALLGFPFWEHGVGLWTIEHNAYLDGGDMRGKIREIMDDNNYVLARKDVTCGELMFEDWFINKNLL